MNSADILLYIAIVCFIVAGVLLIFAVAIFFKFDIINVIEDVTGKSFEKGVQFVLKENEESEEKKKRTVFKKFDTTSGLSQSKTLDRREEINHINRATELDSIIKNEEAYKNNSDVATTLLRNDVDSATTLLHNESKIFESDYETKETTLLYDAIMSDEETTLLDDKEESDKSFVISETDLVVHTDEIIKI
ncbi:MAG: hypothetical protein K6B67_04960 [Lachnospiraceae bacterium]|nr:hypothetical protein [Lachnospiraceae bacterium]